MEIRLQKLEEQMLRQIRPWMLGILSVVGVAFAGYAYASNCHFPPTEVLEMQLISVTYDGIPQVDPPEYVGVSGWLKADPAPKRIFMKLEQNSDTYPRQLEAGYFDGE